MAGSRLFVQDAVHDELLERLAARAKTIRLGDPLDPETEMGPVAFEGHMEHVLSAIGAATAEGATARDRRRAHRTRPASSSSRRSSATCSNGMDIARNEIFGPVLAALRFSDEEEVVALANATEYGLAAGVWTRDVQRAHRMARALRAGTIWINSYRAVGPMAPFGGFKASGIGPRERPPGGGRVHGAQDGLDRAHRRDPRPVPARLSVAISGSAG